MNDSATPALADGCAWVAGDYVPVGAANVSVLDAGLVHSDATYDVAGVWQGRFFRLDAHIDRFFRGSEKLQLTPPVTKQELAEIMSECVRRSGIRDAYVEVVLTRGVPAPGVRDPRRSTPTLIVFAIPYVWISRPEEQEGGGVGTVIARNTRRISSDAVDPTVKNYHWGDLVRGQYEAYERGATQVILLASDGTVTEGPGFNVFGVVDGVLVTPARGVLEGITRRTAIEIARDAGIPVEERDVFPHELARASEIFITSTAGGIMPVRTLDGGGVTRDGALGELTRVIRDEYWRLHSEPSHSFDVFAAN